jgi:endo-1,4-beta-mannosidase
MSEAFTLGVNYWPRRKAMFWWSQFDPGEVGEDFSLIADLGLSVVRIFLLWEDFQPDPQTVDRGALRRLIQAADLAGRYGLGLDITFFTGHMSGPNWAPAWLLSEGGRYASPYFAAIRQVVSRGQVIPDGRYRNPFHDPAALEAERRLLRTVATALADHPAVWMWNLGNEPDLFAWPESDQAGRAWVREMAELVKSIDPRRPVTIGLHADSLAQNNRLRVDQVYRETDMAVMHGYPMYTPWARGPLDPDYVPFLCALTAALSGKPALAEEFGGCTAPPGEASQTWEWTAYGSRRKQFMASEEDLAEYLRQTLPRLVDVGASGALVWCFADYATELWERPPCKESRHERFFGLVRPDGTLKPHAGVLQEFAATRPTVQPIPAYARFEFDGEAYYAGMYDRLAAIYQAYLNRKSQEG